jgi:hypothetical protein
MRGDGHCILATGSGPWAVLTASRDRTDTHPHLDDSGQLVSDHFVLWHFPAIGAAIVSVPFDLHRGARERERKVQ